MPQFLFQIPPQIWRLGTNFLLTGPQLGLLFDTYFLYHYLTALEVGNPRFARREDVIWYLMFVCTVITVSCYCRCFGSPPKPCYFPLGKLPPLYTMPIREEHLFLSCYTQLSCTSYYLPAQWNPTAVSGSWK